ncbi:putative auxin response factor [Helianthus annuus]|nr:putative auxin response factor [Helianthus annuus]
MHIPNYPSLPPQLIYQLHNVTIHADVETDEVYAQMTLQPLTPVMMKLSLSRILFDLYSTIFGFWKHI